MKTARLCAKILRIVGWIVIGIAVAVSIYALATGTAPFNTVKGGLESFGVSMGAFERVPFNHAYYSALNNAAVTRDQQESIRLSSASPYFQPWFERMAAGEDVQAKDDLKAYYDELSFDPQAYLSYYEQLESSEDSRALKEAVEYLDGISKPAAGKGGKLAKLQAASVAPDIEAAYAELSNAHGEEAGAYLEYVETLVSMIKNDIAGGKSVTDARAYAKALDYSAYLEALAAHREQEKEVVYDVRDDLAERLQGQSDGKAALVSFMSDLYASFNERYGSDVTAKENLFVRTVYPLLTD
ncbi:MAG: hypothetical protein IJ174_06815, partial [Clostridia bacterium]|nr:hypothetical protein [Clostridia bacterium]